MAPVGEMPLTAAISVTDDRDQSLALKKRKDVCVLSRSVVSDSLQPHGL